jgi:hypothetical protein
MSGAVFVYPVPAWLRGRLLDKPRLYAFPVEPEPPGETFIILDSGAFGLSQRGRTMDVSYLGRLGAHYKRHGASDRLPIVAVAPDVYLDPQRTLDNWRGWSRRAAPVIQFAARGQISERLARVQAAEYARRRPSVWCVSNPGLRARPAKLLGIESVFRALKREYAAEWVHCLGAGWDAEDLREWAQCDSLDSFDSIAHYTNPAFEHPPSP